MESDDTGAQKRQSERIKVNITCDVRIDSAVWLKDTLTDLTPHGFRIERTPMCRVGAKVWIRIPGLAPQMAEIRWVAGHEAGCSFLWPLAECVFDHIVRVAKGA